MRVRVPRFVLIVVACLALGAAGAFAATGGESGPYPADGPFLSWEPFGSRADDGAVLGSSLDVWDRDGKTAGPHTDGRLLFAGEPIHGDWSSPGLVVFAEARDGDGNPRLGVFTNLDWSGAVEPRGALRLIADQRAPDPATTRVVGVLATDGFPDDPSAFAIAEPGANIEGFSSADWDSYSDGHAESRFWTEVLPKGATAQRTVVAVTSGGETIYDGPIAESARP